MSKRRKRAPWIKLYGDYTTTPSHADLDAHALWVGVVVMQLVRAASDALGERMVWAVQPSGAPVSIAGIARTARLTVPQTRKAVAMLVASRTFAEREDGAIGCPRFWSFQETPDAQRKRDGRTEYPPDVRSESNQEDRGQRSSPLRSEPSIEPFGLSPPNPPAADVVGLPSPVPEIEPTPGRGRLPADSEAATPPAANAAPVLTHPEPEPHAGKAARERRRAAVELWDWHEGERVRRLLSAAHKPRQATEEYLRRVLRLHAHVRKAHDCTEPEAWERVRAYREERLRATEMALREGHPEAEKWRSYCAGDAAWSRKGYDYLAERGPDPKAAKRAADEAFRLEVARRKAGGG